MPSRTQHLASVLALTLLPLAALAQAPAAKPAAAPAKAPATHAAHSGCTITPNNYLGWHAQKMANRWVTLEIVPQIGGRLMQVTFNGHDFLYINQQEQGKVLRPGPDVRAGNYGGDKIWPLPEGTRDEQHWAQGGLQPLDYGDYKLQVISRGVTCAVRMTGPDNPDTTGQRYIREISIGSDSPIITFKSTMQNMSGFPQTWSEQTITEYPTTTDPDGKIANDKLYSVTETNPKSVFPNGFHLETGRPDNGSTSVKDGQVWVHWNNQSQEVWMDSPNGWLASIEGNSGYTMIERHHIDPFATYPGGANLIFYSSGGRGARPGQPAPATAPPPGPFIEEEVNSPMVELAPNQSYTMETTWYPTRMDENFKTTTWSGVVGTPLTANRTPAGLVLAGKFGVFYSGNLVAHLYANGGANSGPDEKLISVSPFDPITLDSTIQAPPNTARISIHLVDEKGNDRGPLGEALVNPPPPRGGRGGGFGGGGGGGNGGGRNAGGNNGGGANRNAGAGSNAGGNNAP